VTSKANILHELSICTLILIKNQRCVINYINYAIRNHNKHLFFCEADMYFASGDCSVSLVWSSPICLAVNVEIYHRRTPDLSSVLPTGILIIKAALVTFLPGGVFISEDHWFLMRLLDLPIDLILPTAL
jgi:hypothetical protein